LGVLCKEKQFLESRAHHVTIWFLRAMHLYDTCEDFWFLIRTNVKVISSVIERVIDKIRRDFLLENPQLLKLSSYRRLVFPRCRVYWAKVRMTCYYKGKNLHIVSLNDRCFKDHNDPARKEQINQGVDKLSINFDFRKGEFTWMKSREKNVIFICWTYSWYTTD